MSATLPDQDFQRQLALERIAKMTESINDIETIRQCAITTARENGATLQQIADALGVSRQAVHSRIRNAQLPFTG